MCICVLVATEGSDFNLIRDMVTFDQGANNGNVITTTIDVLDDPLVEGTETFIISGSVAPPASFVTGRDTANVTILDNDGKCALRIPTDPFHDACKHQTYS